MSERTWSALSAAQADGLACVICGRELTTRAQRHVGSRVGLVWVPVGHSPTGSQVFACAGECAQVGRAPGAVLIPTEALIAAGAAFLRALEVAAAGDLRRAWPDDVVIATVTAAAPLLVAAELRRLADAAEAGPPGGGEVPVSRSGLRRRADQLDPTGGGEWR
jgi:hypothetical protein